LRAMNETTRWEAVVWVSLMHHPYSEPDVQGADRPVHEQTPSHHRSHTVLYRSVEGTGSGRILTGGYFLGIMRYYCNQVGPMLINRAANTELTWSKEMQTRPSITTDFDYTLDMQAVLTAIHSLNFAQLKGTRRTVGMFHVSPSILVPGQCQIVADECSAENNTVTVAWRAPCGSYVDGYILEMDDGAGGTYKVGVCVRVNMM
jgi:hypothetical protein